MREADSVCTDDQSHFTLGEGKEGEDEEETANDIDALWEIGRAHV